ncbi:M14 family zinc carboxypeptidase [Winogradskyella sp. PE311]|uniref:M14 family zinc carboxypeptidase n=1 Tax=Winogradskyella sp. PE311 TaxID=3366943 RepID=UPI00398025C6
MKKIILSVVTSTMLFISAYAQELLNSDIDNLLNIQGEVTFTFTIGNEIQLKEFSEDLTIINFNVSTKEVKAWANENQFKKFLELKIPYKVFKADNDINQRLMSNKISGYSKNTKQGYTLDFPLKAYPTYSDYASQMQNFETEHSDIVNFFSIGSTEQGDKEILFVKISDNISIDEAEPKLLYTSSMHGDEIAGFTMMLNLIDYLITAYKTESHPDHKRIFKLINGSEIWINPNANPDGTYHLSRNNTSVANARRGNFNNIDLNRNYPDNINGAHSDNENYQSETLLFMELAEKHHFVTAANFHGGSELVNYPWDNTFERHADDSWWKLTAGEYRDIAQEVAPNGYMDDENNGVTNGADWYRIYGSRQDYMNHSHQCKELTVELSEIKKPYANQLNSLWNYNKEALISYLEQGTYGFRGVVKDAETGLPIKGTTVKVIGHDAHGSWTITDIDGDFYRPIYAGKYDLIFEAPNYRPIILSNEIIGNYETKTLENVFMSSILSPIESSITSNTYKSNYILEGIKKTNHQSEAKNSRAWLNLVMNIQTFR